MELMDCEPQATFMHWLHDLYVIEMFVVFNAR
jgi:hypothetical protein